MKKEQKMGNKFMNEICLEGFHEVCERSPEDIERQFFEVRDSGSKEEREQYFIKQLESVRSECGQEFDFFCEILGCGEHIGILEVLTEELELAQEFSEPIIQEAVEAVVIEDFVRPRFEKAARGSEAEKHEYLLLIAPSFLRGEKLLVRMYSAMFDEHAPAKMILMIGERFKLDSKEVQKIILEAAKPPSLDRSIN